MGLARIWAQSQPNRDSPVLMPSPEKAVATEASSVTPHPQASAQVPSLEELDTLSRWCKLCTFISYHCCDTSLCSFPSPLPCHTDISSSHTPFLYITSFFPPTYVSWDDFSPGLTKDPDINSGPLVGGIKYNILMRLISNCSFSRRTETMH